MRIANEPVNYTSKVLANVLIGLFDFKVARVSVARQKAPVANRAHVFTLQRLRKPEGFKVPDESLEGVSVLVLVAKTFAGVSTWRKRWEIWS